MGGQSKMVRRIAAIILGIFFLFGCEPAGVPPEKRIDIKINRVGQPIKVTVHFYDSTKDLENIYALTHNLTRYGDSGILMGFAVWKEWFDNGVRVEFPDKYECVIYSRRPKSIDDKYVTTLGHEMLHCIYGAYHKD